MSADIKNACMDKCKLSRCIRLYVIDKRCKHSDYFLDCKGLG